MEIDRSFLARLYLWQARRWTSLMRAVDGAWIGLWLGVLSHRQLEAVDELHYRRNRTYNGEAHNLGGLMPWEMQAVDGFFHDRHRLALIGAGGGREVLALERRGHQVDGFECNRTLVRFAADFLPRQGAAARVRLLERDAVPPPGDYDGVILGWSAYALIEGRDRRTALLRQLRALVPDGAPLLLSFFTREQGAFRLRMVRRVARALRWLLRRAPPELGDDLMPLYVHRFDRAELEAELRSAGFALARFEPEGSGRRDSGWAVALAEPIDVAHS